MQLSHPLHPLHPPRVPATPLARPQAGRIAAPWPFYVQAPRPPCCDMDLNVRRVLETSARYFAAPLTPEPAAAPAAKRAAALK